MKRNKRRCLAVLLTVLCLLSLTSCAGGFGGYEKEDLTRYVTPGVYTGLPLSPIMYEVTEEQVEAAIAEALAGTVLYLPVEDAAMPRDLVVFSSVSLREDGSADTVHTADSVSALIGVKEEEEEEWIALAKEKLIGLSAGEETVWEWTHETETEEENAGLFAGRKQETLRLSLKVREVSRPETPKKLTEEVLPLLSEKAETVEAYRDEVRERLESEAYENALSQRREKVWNAIVLSTVISTYPEDEVSRVADQTLRDFKTVARSYDMSLKDFLSESYGMTEEEFRERIEAYARDTIKEYLTLYAIAQKEDLLLTDEEYAEGVAAFYEQNAGDFSSAEELVNTIGVEEMERGLLWQKVMEWVEEHAAP